MSNLKITTDSFNLYTSVTVLGQDKEGKILFVKIKKGPMKDTWVLPGGFVEQQEEPKEAAIRELQEETGISYQGSLEILDAVKDTLHPGGWGIEIFYKAESISSQVVAQTEETSNAQFFSKNKLPTPINEIHRGIIEKYIL